MFDRKKQEEQRTIDRKRQGTKHRYQEHSHKGLWSMATNHRKSMICLMVGLICAASYGEELPDLITRLQKLDGRNPIRAMVHIEAHTSKTEDKDAKPFEQTDLMITADANTLTLSVTNPLSDTRILREFSPLRAAELIHYGPPLARELSELKLLEKRSDSHQGLPCTRWRMESEKKESRLWMSSTTRRDVELWIDSDGYPVAGSFKTQAKANVLLLKINSESERYQRYARRADRLLLVLDRYDTDVKTRVGDEKRTVTTTVDVEKN
jgi:hypothetical protein